MQRDTIILLAVCVIASSFGVTMAMALRHWHRDGLRSLRWIVVSSGTLFIAWALFASATFSLETVNTSPRWTVAFLALTVAPWMLMRFAIEVSGPRPRARVVGDSLAAISVVIQLLVPERLALGYVDPSPSQAAAHASIAMSSLYSIATAAFVLWRAGRSQPHLVRRRMRLLAASMIALHLSMVSTGNREYPEVLVFTSIMVCSILLLAVAAAPPRLLRQAWQARLLRNVLSDMAATSNMTSEPEVIARLLPTMVSAVSAQEAILRCQKSGEVLGAWTERRSEEPERADVRVVELTSGDLALELRGTPHDLFIGAENMQLAETLVVHLQVALDRQRDRAAQLAAVKSMEVANEALRVANAELEKIAEVRDNFVAIASHELRTPITTILGFTITLLDQWTQLDDERRLEFLQWIDHSARRLGQLVEDLLVLSAVESPGFQTQRERVELAEVIEDARIDSGIATSDEVLDVDVPAAAAVLADPRQLRQVLVNLLVNARKHGDEPFRLSVLDAGDVMRISVVDSGPGVPKEFQDRLFERFRRATTERSTHGSGLGLFVVRRLLEIQGGRVWYEDAEPHGACFVVELPAAQIAQ